MSGVSLFKINVYFQQKKNPQNDPSIFIRKETYLNLAPFHGEIIKIIHNSSNNVHLVIVL